MSASDARIPRVGVVVIGRNEGEKLLRGLASVLGRSHPVVYVDSHSQDGSVDAARAVGANVVALDDSRMLTAARGRNVGFEAILAELPDCEFVQFLDGDCELQRDWIGTAADFLRQNPDVGIVAGRLREREPDASPYHRLASMEWEGPTGDVAELGGIAMVRTDAFRQIGGYEANMPGGEDPDLCARMLGEGFRVVRLPDEMAVHDIEMTDFGEWWTRHVRPGRAWAETLARRGAQTPDVVRRRLASVIAWGGALPAISLMAAWPTRGWSLLLLLGFPVLACRIYRSARANGRTSEDAWLYAGACTVGKLAEFEGLLIYVLGRLRDRFSARRDPPAVP